MSEPDKGSTPGAEAMSGPDKGFTPGAEAMSEPDKGSTPGAEAMSEPDKGFTPGAEAMSEPDKGFTPGAEAMSEPDKGSTPAVEAGEPSLLPSHRHATFSPGLILRRACCATRRCRPKPSPGWWATATYAIGSLERLRPFAYRIARLAAASGPHNVGLRLEDGVLTMRVESAVGVKLTGDQYRLVASVDECYGEMFGA